LRGQSIRKGIKCPTSRSPSQSIPRPDPVASRSTVKWSEAGDRTVCRGVIVREHDVTVCATSLRSCEPELEIDRSSQHECRSNRYVSDPSRRTMSRAHSGSGSTRRVSVVAVIRLCHASKPPVGAIPRCVKIEEYMIGRSPVRFALNDFALSFTLFPKALFTFRSHYFFAVGLGAPCLAFADGHLPVCTARSNCATLRRGVD